NFEHLRRYPVDGTVVRGYPGTAHWVFQNAYCVPHTATSNAVGVDNSSLNCSAALTVKDSSLAPGNVGRPYTVQMAGLGGAGRIAWRISAGALPSGLKMSASGSITGIPTKTGTYRFTVTVSDVAMQKAARALAITIRPGTLTARTPTISGTSKVGSTLTARPGSWGPAPIKIKYQWRANGSVIGGATASTFKIATKYAGKKITVTVTGSKTGYTTTAKTSAATKPVRR
ncbi:hypothetical protein D1871_22280, partial [Nakamurella silvestris]